MIKKMWALFLNGKIFSFDNGRRVSIYLKPKDKKEMGKNEEQKPVWVCDRDPHENVRKVMKELSSDCVTLFYAKRAGRNTICNLFKALEKDLKNTEGAG